MRLGWEKIISIILGLIVLIVLITAIINRTWDFGSNLNKVIVEPIAGALGLSEKSKCQNEGFFNIGKGKAEKLYCEKSKQCLSLNENVCDPNSYKPKGCNDWCNADTCNKGPCPVELGCLNNQCAKCGKTGDKCEGVWPFNIGQCCDGFKCVDMHLNIVRGHCEKR